MKRFICIFLLIAALPLMPHPIGIGDSQPAVAADEQDDVLKAIKRGDVMPYSKIKRIAESKLNGVVVGQQLRRTNRGWQYDLRVRRKDGRVMVAIVNAQTGEILRTR